MSRRDTVAGETPAIWAICLIVAMRSSPSCTPGRECGRVLEKSIPTMEGKSNQRKVMNEEKFSKHVRTKDVHVAPAGRIGMHGHKKIAAAAAIACQIDWFLSSRRQSLQIILPL